MFTKVIISCVLLGVSLAYPEGPPASACVHMFPTDHGADAQDGTPYFQITVSSQTYTPGTALTVTLTATSNYYEGVFLQARSTNCSDTKPQGTFTLAGGETFLKLMNCGVANNAVSQKVKEHITSKQVTWTPPAQSVGQVFFRGTFVRNEKTFWTDIFSPVVKPTGDSSAAGSYCSVVKTNSASTTGISTVAVLCFVSIIKLFSSL